MVQRLRQFVLRAFPLLDRHAGARQFIKFCLVGASNVAIDFSIFLLLTGGVGLHYLVANLGSFFVAVSWSFFANRRWTFRHAEGDARRQYLRFALTNLGGLLIQSSLLFMLHERAGFDVRLAKIFAIFVTTFWNFFLTKFWTFRRTA